LQHGFDTFGLAANGPFASQIERLPVWCVSHMKELIMTNRDQGIVRDNKGEEQPADKERARM
jgi:hypothetical protein